jgi:hypothetical protein
MHKSIAAVACQLLFACSAFAATLTAEEAKLVSGFGMEAKIATQLKQEGTTIERFDADGIVIAALPGTGDAALAQVRLRLHGTPFRAYLDERHYGYGPDRIAIVRTDDLGYLAIVRTAGVNHDVSHDQVVARYKAWDAKYGLVLVGAGQDWLEATFRTPPNDWLAFAKEVAAFCPDVVEQGTGSVEALAKEMSESDSVYLWWD